MRYTRISADCHLDLPWMPPDLFTSNASAAMRDRVPYVADGPDGPYWTCKNGTSFGLVNGVGPAGQKFVPGSHHRVDVMAATGLYADGGKGIRRVSDPHLRAKDMDLDGVQAEVIYGILGAATRLGDHEAATEMFRIYNDWLVEFCRPYPDRSIGLACLPYGDIDAAVKEVHRVARLGLRGMELSCSWDMEPMWHPLWEPLWQAVNEVGLPLHFHDLGLRMKPSDYWRRQCKATFQFDRIGTKLLDDIGVETVMWGSDYPHGDGVWPESSKYIEEQFGHLPADVTHKIICENAGRFYGLIS